MSAVWLCPSAHLLVSRITGLTKLCDANKAGSRRADECTLILTEGDSAKALAVAGLGVVGRDTYGVFPLRGKLLNVRDAKHDQIMKNEEIQNIKKILGLQHNKTYTSVDGLRYGRLMLMTDQVGVVYHVALCSGDSEGCWHRTTMVRISKVFSSTTWTTSSRRS